MDCDLIRGARGTRSPTEPQLCGRHHRSGAMPTNTTISNAAPQSSARATPSTEPLVVRPREAWRMLDHFWIGPNRRYSCLAAARAPTTAHRSRSSQRPSEPDHARVAAPSPHYACAGRAMSLIGVTIPAATQTAQTREALILRVSRRTFDEIQHPAQRRPILYDMPTGFNLRQGQA